MGGFGLIADILDLRVPLPFDLSPNLKLCRATDDQLKPLDFFFSHQTQFLKPRQRYEQKWLGNDPGTRQPIYEPLPKEEWRYYIIAFDHWKNFESFRLAANLTEPTLKFFFLVYTSEAFGRGTYAGGQSDTVRATDWYQITAQSPPIVTVDADALARMSSAYLDVCNLNQKKHEGIWRALQSLQTLQRIPTYSDLVILGYFSIIEMLLTHNPNDKEIGDSLVHQIRTKVALLNCRLLAPLNYAVFPQIPKEDKVWNTLYALRSAVAHGSPIDFKNSLKGLVNRSNALDFLNLATRRLLRHSVSEPQLVDDLKPI